MSLGTKRPLANPCVHGREGEKRITVGSLCPTSITSSEHPTRGSEGRLSSAVCHLGYNRKAVSRQAAQILVQVHTCLLQVSSGLAAPM